MTDEPVRRYEFDRYREDVDRRFGRVEQDVERLSTEHETDMENLATEKREAAKEKRERRRWTWQEILATIGAAAVLAGLWLQATHR